MRSDFRRTPVSDDNRIVRSLVQTICKSIAAPEYCMHQTSDSDTSSLDVPEVVKEALRFAAGHEKHRRSTGLQLRAR